MSTLLPKLCDISGIINNYFVNKIMKVKFEYSLGIFAKITQKNYTLDNIKQV